MVYKIFKNSKNALPNSDLVEIGNRNLVLQTGSISGQIPFVNYFLTILSTYYELSVPVTIVLEVDILL